MKKIVIFEELNSFHLYLSDHQKEWETISELQTENETHVLSMLITSASSERLCCEVCMAVTHLDPEKKAPGQVCRLEELGPRKVLCVVSHGYSLLGPSLKPIIFNNAVITKEREKERHLEDHSKSLATYRWVHSQRWALARLGWLFIASVCPTRQCQTWLAGVLTVWVAKYFEHHPGLTSWVINIGVYQQGA